jgi:hypothetical protein
MAMNGSVDGELEGIWKEKICRLHLAGYLFRLRFGTEDEGKKWLGNVDELLPEHTAPHPRIKSMNWKGRGRKRP